MSSKGWMVGAAAIAALVSAAACGPAAPAPAAPLGNHVGAAPPATRVVTLRRTACMGQCPEYEVALFDDGTVTWHGEANVAVIGDRTAHVDPGNVQALVAVFVGARFMERDDEGRLPQPACHKLPDGSEECSGEVRGCSDTPHAQLLFVLHGKVHLTDDAHCGGEDALIRLEDLTDATADDGKWRGGGEAP